MSNHNVFCFVHLPALGARQTRENIPLVCAMWPFLPCTMQKVRHIEWEKAPPHHPIFYIYSVKKRKITYKLKWTWDLEKGAARAPALVGAPNPWQVTPKWAKIGPACSASLLWRQARKGSPEKRRDLSFRLDVSQRRLAANSLDWWAIIRLGSLFLLPLS